LRNEHRIREAHLVLAHILARFAEGFATADLMTAKALLEELQAPGLQRRPEAVGNTPAPRSPTTGDKSPLVT
jgi:hypothetical protein